MNWALVFRVIDAGFAVAQKAVDWNEARLAKQRKAREWANAPAGVRGCPRCNEIVYTPFRDTCTKCGALL
jgi:hypothetical protein